MGEEYDFIVIDCRPSLELLELNALAASDYVIIPVIAERLALYGTDQLMEFYEEVREHIRSELEILGVLLTRVDNRNVLTGKVREEVRTFFKEKVFETEIRVNVRLAEFSGLHPSILAHSPNSAGAEDYRKLAREVLDRV